MPVVVVFAVAELVPLSEPVFVEALPYSVLWVVEKVVLPSSWDHACRDLPSSSRLGVSI